MARRVKDATLESKAEWRRLRSHGTPYYRSIDKGLHLGYRRVRGRGAVAVSGTWVLRRYLGNGKYAVESIGIADDLSDADGISVLDFWQAQLETRKRAAAALKSGAAIQLHTVADVMEAYLEHVKKEGLSTVDSRARFRAHIENQLGALKIADLTSEKIRTWIAELVAQPPRVRTKHGGRQKHKIQELTPDKVRARKATANRTLTVLKAALNLAWRKEHVPSNAA